jgi:hypothetical protein
MLAGHDVEVAVLVDIPHGEGFHVVLVQELSLELRIGNPLKERAKPKERKQEKQGGYAMHDRSDSRLVVFGN